jgi:hypothetical protein
VSRRSSSSLSVVPVIPGSGRPLPPRGLDQAERRLWKSVVAALPAHWVDSVGQQVLRRAVSLMATLERWEIQLREYRARGTAGDAEAVKLAWRHCPDCQSAPGHVARDAAVAGGQSGGAEQD